MALQKYRFSILMMTVFFIMAILSGCTPKQSQQINIDVTGGYSVQDGTGYTLAFAKKPQKIVSLTLGSDEILLSLVSEERIKALTNYSGDAGISNVVEQAAKINKIKANAETVIALNPDLVFMADWQPLELAQILRDANIPVYVYHTPETLEEIRTNILNIAETVGEPEKGKQLAADMDKNLANITEKVKNLPQDRRLVILQYSTFGVTGSKKSIFNDIVNKAGLINGAVLAKVEEHGSMSKEKMVEVNPDIILTPSWDYDNGSNVDKFAADVKNDESLQTIKAIKNNKIVMLPDKHLNCLSQNIVLGVYDLVKAAYPELLPKG